MLFVIWVLDFPAFRAGISVCIRFLMLNAGEFWALATISCPVVTVNQATAKASTSRNMSAKGLETSWFQKGSVVRFILTGFVD